MKRLIIALPTIVFVWHIFATVIYLGPENLIKQHLQTKIYSYINPIFSQDWHLFSPDPGISRKRLWVACSDKTSDEKEYFDPSEHIRDSHHKFPFTGRGKLLYVYRQLPSSIIKSMKDITMKQCNDKASREEDEDMPLAKCEIPKSDLHKEFKKTKAYAVVFRTVSDICKKKNPSSRIAYVSALEFMPQKYSKRLSGDRWSSISRYDLEAFEL